MWITPLKNVKLSTCCILSFLLTAYEEDGQQKYRAAHDDSNIMFREQRLRTALLYFYTDGNAHKHRDE